MIFSPQGSKSSRDKRFSLYLPTRLFLLFFLPLLASLLASVAQAQPAIQDSESASLELKSSLEQFNRLTSNDIVNSIKATQMSTVEIERVASLGGTFTTSAADPPYVYLGRGPSLAIVDASDPTLPILASSLALEGSVTSIHVVDAIAYVVVNNSLIYIVDISDKTQPQRLGSTYLPTSYSTAIADNLGYYDTLQNIVIKGGFVYVVGQINGFQIIDVSDPLFPVVRSTYSVASSFLIESAERVVVEANRAYTIFRRDGQSILRIFDITNPDNMYLTGLYTFPVNEWESQYSQLIVSEGMVHYALADALYVINTVDRADPFLHGVYRSRQSNSPLSVHAVEEDDTVISLYEPATDSTWLEVVHIEERSGISLYKSHQFTETQAIGAVRIAEDNLYVTAYSRQGSPLHVMGSITATESTPLQTITDVSANIHLTGNLIYDASALGIDIVDLSMPIAQGKVGQYRSNAYAMMSKLHNNIAYNVYISDSTDQRTIYIIEAVDITTLGDPIVVDTIELIGSPINRLGSTPLLNKGGLSFSDAFLFFAVGDNNIQIVDISNPTNLLLARIFSVPGLVEGLDAVDALLYVASGSTGLHVIDINDPLNPELLSTYDTPGLAHHVQVVEQLAYVADDTVGVQVIDVSQPDAPLLQSTLETEIRANEVQIRDNYLYILPPQGFGIRAADRLSQHASPSIQIIDLEDPATVTNPVGIYSAGTGPIAIVDNHLYLFEQYYGLRVYDVRHIQNIVEIGAYWLPSYYPTSPGVAVSGDTILLAGQEAGLHILHKTDFSFAYLPFSINDSQEDRSLLYNIAIVGRCEPQAGGTWVSGRVYRNGIPTSGDIVVFSYTPDGPHIASIQAGAHVGYTNWDTGYYSHIIDARAPREGDWYFWIVNQFGERISEIAYVHTDGPDVPGGCSQVMVDFDSR